MDSIYKGFAAACGAVASFFCGMPPLIGILLVVMSIDYATGIICAWMGKSPKTEGGGLSSKAARDGLIRKVGILLEVGLAAAVDYAVEHAAGVSFSAITGTVCLWFVASEGVSILENGAEMGVPMPEMLKRALEVMKGSGGNEGKSE